VEPGAATDPTRPPTTLSRYGEAVVLLLLGLPAAVIDWQIAATWSVPTWIRLLAAAVLASAFAAVVVTRRLRHAGAPLTVAILYGLPVVGGIIRWHSVPSTTALIGDGAYQMQLSRGVLMRGIDPYGFNYVGTGMERAPWGQSFPNPALHHLDYWPGTVLVPLPIQAAFKALFGWWDERLWLLLAGVAIWVLLGRIAPGSIGRMAAIAFFLIPGHSLLAVLGDNDLPMVALLLGAVLAINNRRWLAAGALIGLAIATKQTALIALPVLIGYGFVGRRIDLGSFLKAGGVAFGIVGLLFIPFLVWNARAFVTDTILFNFGAGSETYPIQGIGLSSWLLESGIIHGARDAFPFLLIQLPLAFAAWFLAWRWFRRHQLAGDAILWMGLAFFVFLFANRFSQQAYLLLGVELVLAGLIARLLVSARVVREPAFSAAA
jgi:glycosyl transferase family 87